MAFCRREREDPQRIGADGRDTVALHLLVAQREVDGVKWLIERAST